RKGRAHARPSARKKKRRRAARTKTRAAVRKTKRCGKGQPTSRWMKWLGTCDQIVEYFKPQHRPQWMRAKTSAPLPQSIQVRELRYRATQPGFRVTEIGLVTTLLDGQLYPAVELAALYQQRWEIETNLRHLKQTLRMDVLRTKTVDGIHKELAMYAIVYNLIRLVMLQSARRQNVPVPRISFIDAQRRLRHAIPGAPLRTLIVVPERPGRYELRVRKRRPKEYSLMQKPRHV